MAPKTAAPKKGEVIAPAIPEVEDEVVMPEEVEPVPEPSFCFVLGHLVGHTFLVEDRPPSPAEDAPTPTEPPQPTLREFDPSGLIFTKAKEPGDALLKNVIVIEREDLQVVATAEEKTLAVVLQHRLEKEKAARQRRKHNDARRAAITALEASKAAAEEGGEAAPAPDTAEEQGPKADTLVLLRDYPSSAVELQEISALGLCAEGLVDLWTAVYMAGGSLGEVSPDAAPDEYGELPERPVVIDEPPEMVQLFYDSIHAAAINSDLANCTVCTLPKSHTLAFAPAEVPLADHANNAVLEAVGTEAARRQQFTSWLQRSERGGVVPSLSEKDKEVEMRLYERMMGSVDPLHHDVPLFLHCLTEQVSSNLGGQVDTQEDKVALSSLLSYLGDSCNGILSNGGDPMQRPASRDGPGSPAKKTVPVLSSSGEGPNGESVLPHLDRALCSHSMAGGGSMENGELVMTAVHSVLRSLSVPGVKRSGLPEDASHSAAQREALKTRIYPFAPGVPSSEFEQYLLLHAFEDLCNRAQPERKYRLDDRIYHERIPRRLLAQTLGTAFQCEPFVSTAYLPRHDCLLVALHHRSLPGRVMWHSWNGDLATPNDSERWNQSLFTTPTYNDWAHIVGGGSSTKYPEPPRVLDGLDGRQYGYVKTTEKLATPSDGSIILVTKFDQGLKESFPYPSAAMLQAAGADAAPLGLDLADGAESVAESVAQSTTGALMAAMTAAEPKFDAPVRYSSQLARVMKDGLRFGLVHDSTWAERQRAERDRRVALVTGAAEVSDEAAGSRPESRGMPDDAAVESSAAQELPFSGYKFGQFWLSFSDGARYNVRMHHERAELPSGSGPGFADDYLPPFGAMVSYTMASGSVMQVFSDGALRLMWPLAAASRDDGPALAPVATAESMLRLPVGNRPYFQAGCPEDIEVMRTIMPFGTVVRKLLSGRTEVYHSDSTTAARNPSSEELHAELADLRIKHGPNGSSRVELLERLCKVYAERKAEAPITSTPSDKEKAAGLPGHWVVTRPDGSMFGRALPPTRARTASLESTDGGPPGSAGASSSPDAVAQESTPQSPQLSFVSIMGGRLGEDGAVEYPIRAAVSVATQVDLQTQHQTRTNSAGLWSYADPDGSRRICVHADGTRVTKIVREGGYDILIQKEPMAFVRCELNDSRSGVGMRMFVDCSDGAQLEIVPQTLSPSSGLLPLDQSVRDLNTNSTNAYVLLKRPDIASIVSDGKGQVEVLTGLAAAAAGYPDGQRMRASENASSSNAYVAQCSEGRLSLRDPEGQEFVLSGDQTLTVSGSRSSENGRPSSPRCYMPGVAYQALGMEGEPAPPIASPPRLFVIYGNGDAEELMSENDAHEVLKAAKADAQATVVEGEEMEAPLKGCRCHSIFLTKVLDGGAKPGAGGSTESVSFSAGSVDSAWSQGSLPTAISQAPPPKLMSFRQLIQYPGFSEENHQRFLGTLKQYQEWEKADLLRNRAVMAGSEDKKKGLDKGAKKPSKKDDKKKKKKSKGPVVEQAAPEIVEAVLPKFAEDFNLNVFEHAVETLRIRSELLPELTNKELLTQALASQGTADNEADLTRLQQDRAELGAGYPPAAAGDSGSKEGSSPLPTPAASPTGAPKEKEEKPMPDESEGKADDSKTAGRASRPKLNDAPTFSYFKSDLGLQFLLDEGELDPERRAPIKKEKVSRSLEKTKKRTPWNPLLLGEAQDEAPQEAHEHEQVPEDRDERRESQQVRLPSRDDDANYHEQENVMEGDPYGQARLPIVAEDADTPLGPHPDKKGNLWDIYGQPRQQRPVASHAYVMLNTDYLEVEGATDRRVRTSSIAHKKNSGKAPSVQSVRKTGVHALGSGTELAAKEILGEIGLQNPEEHWKLTSTMQGLGDSNSLVEVTPGICRFGPVRQGGVYRMAFYLRNLDVDVTRFNVSQLKSEFVSVSHQPGQIAPGMAAKIIVEIMAKQPGKVEQLVEVRVKAHVIRVPVTARILEAEEYDRLDSESVALHGRHIGRHREKSDAGEKRPVEVITDENYCRKVLGESNYRPQAADFGEDTPLGKNN